MQIEADDASVPLGRVQPVRRQSSTLSSSAQRQPLISVASGQHALEDLQSSAARASVIDNSAHKQPQSAALPITIASQLSHSQSSSKQGSMYNSFTHKQPTTIKPMSTVFQIAQQLDGKGLKFSPEFGGPAWDSASALTALAEGQARCAVTGDAFEHLLHCDDLFTLQTIMRNVVVFARMQSHQKGQVMDLLTIRGLYQMHKGQVRHIEVSHTIGKDKKGKPYDCGPLLSKHLPRFMHLHLYVAYLNAVLQREAVAQGHMQHLPHLSLVMH